jgi:hypothetical protein
MDRRSRHRIGKCEELLSAALKDRDEKLKQVLQVTPTYARCHATAVAAIVLSGRPRIDEPLKRAWARALQHYGIDVNTDPMAAARRLLPIIKGDGNESARFTEIFRTAPVWLLQFTGMALDARLLKFDLPDISDTLAWGSAGYDDARRWPLLPAGTIMAGEPIRDLDPRRLWIALFCIIKQPFIDFAELSREDADIRSPGDKDPLLEGIALALDLERKPEGEWSTYEKRRMRRLSEQISRLRGPE